MQILRQKSQPTATPDLYSISDVRVGFDGVRVQRAGEEEKTELRPRLFVDLEPEVYVRERGFDSSVETMKNACTLQIEIGELERIQKALRQELQDAYQFMLEKGLLAAFERHKAQQESPPSEADNDQPSSQLQTEELDD
jgi:hypothetical protein